MASRTLVVLIPAFGLVVLILNWRRNRGLHPYYSETVVYSLHVHSFFFILLSLSQVSWWLPIRFAILACTIPVACWYMAKSMRTSFGTSWLGSTLRGVFALSIHLILILIVTIIAVLIVLAIV